jgi:hypothetical protein
LSYFIVKTVNDFSDYSVLAMLIVSPGNDEVSEGTAGAEADVLLEGFQRLRTRRSLRHNGQSGREGVTVSN